MNTEQLTREEADKRYMEQPGPWGAVVIMAILAIILLAIVRTDADLLLRVRQLEQRVQELESKIP